MSTRLTTSWRPWALFGALSCVQCLHPADERAEADARVGMAEADGLRVQVAEGAAAVRALSETELVLWASAPAFEFTLRREVSAAARFAVRVDNCMPGSRLEARGGAGVVAPVSGDAPTSCSFSLESAGTEVELRLSPPDEARAATAEAPLRFAVLSDVQEALDRVGDVFAAINAQPDVAFVLGAGNLTEQGTRPQLEQFQREMQALELPYYTTLGNHELGQSPTLYHEFFGRGSHSFAYRGVRFTLLDSASATLDTRVYGWLDGWLQRGRGQVHVVAMHIPPIDPTGVRNGSFASRNEAADLLARLARSDVDLTIYGHIHSYYRFNNAGIDAHISGGGGAIPERFDGIGRHFLVVDVVEDAVQGVQVVRVDR